MCFVHQAQISDNYYKPLQTIDIDNISDDDQISDEILMKYVIKTKSVIIQFVIFLLASNFFVPQSLRWYICVL